MRKVIVNGAAGFIGNAVARQLIRQGVCVIAVVRPGTLKSEEAFRLLDLEAPVIECDLREIDTLPELLGEVEYDAFYQLAWDGVDAQGILNYERQIDNIRWTVRAVEAAAALKCRRFIGAGSVNQLELLNLQGRLFTEDRHRYYRAALLAGEAMGRAAARENGLEFIWPILINVYGEGEIAPRLINNTIKNLIAGKRQSFSAGEQLYDFLHIEDAAKAFCLIGETGREEKQYIVGSGQPKPLKEYLKIIRDIAAPEMELGLGELEFHGIEMTEAMLSIDSLVGDTGFVPEVDFKTGIKRTFEWIKRAYD